MTMAKHCSITEEHKTNRDRILLLEIQCRILTDTHTHTHTHTHTTANRYICVDISTHVQSH